MVSEGETAKLITELTRLCQLNGLDEQLVDFEHEIDRTLSYGENYAALKEAYNLKDKTDMKAAIREQQDRQTFERWTQNKEDGLRLLETYRPFCICITGERNTGKTALAHTVCDRLRQAYRLPVHTLKYPKPELLQRIGYHNMKELKGLEHLQNAVLWLDEPQLLMPRDDHHANNTLMEIMSICRHRNITLVISTSDTRWVNKGLESYIDVWLIKDQDYKLIKNGAVAKYVIRQHTLLDPDAFKLDTDEYLMYYRKDEEFQGKFRFTKPRYWDEEYSKPYQLAETPQKFPKNSPETPEEDLGVTTQKRNN